MDRAETTGFGIAAAGHVLLFLILSAGFAAEMHEPPKLRTPMEVQLVDEVALESSAPVPSLQPPAPRLGEIEGPVEPTPPPPPVPAPEPLPRASEPAPPAPAPKPAPAPRPQPKQKAAAAPAPPQPKAAPAKAAPAPKAPAAKAQAKEAPARPTGRLSGILTGIGETESPSRSNDRPAQVASAAVRSSLAAEVRRQLKPHWRAPTGADAEQLRTELAITLAPNGSVTNVEVLRTTGQTDSNRPQVKLHQEQAVRAVRLASPFKLPAEFYDAWKLLSPIGFDKRLSQ